MRVAPRILVRLLTSAVPAVLASASLATPPPGAGPDGVVAIVPSPHRIRLAGPYDQARIIVDGRTRSGRTVDVSARAAVSVADPRVAWVDEAGIVRPRADGATVAVIRVGALRARVPIIAAGARGATPRFVGDVPPVLTRQGCNMGACHGAAQGKGGFRLSLLGFDPESDYASIVRSSAGRRVNACRPERSLLLRKPSLGVAHKGGLRLAVGSPAYRILADWIAAGMPGPDPREGRPVRLEVQPAMRILARDSTQRFAVRAVFADGATRDVTAHTLFSSSDESTAAVTAEGEAKAVGAGEAAVLARYQGLVATARVVSPFGPPRSTPLAGLHPIDRLVQVKLDALGLPASPRSSDSDFLRRATLDATGRLPTAAEARAFLADRDPDKRRRLVDRLLDSSDYVDFWTLKRADLVRCSRRFLTDKGVVSLYQWIRRSVAENWPWDRFVRELLTARGSAHAEGPANFFRTAATPETLAETASQAFLGVRIQCARCHNHPYEKWTQAQYWQMAAFFARVKTRKGTQNGEQLVLLSSGGEVRHPRTGQQVAPAALDARPLSEAYAGDRRQVLAEWITSPRNPFFARSLVNRVWKHFLGRGLVEPVDDLRVTNPPSNAPLLDWLAQDFVRGGYDVKRLIRTIMLTQTYQRSAEPVPGNERDGRYGSRFPFKRLGAEQLFDALSAATGVAEKFPGYPAGTRAAQLTDTGVQNYFLDLFGRPARATPCECERSDDPTLGQVLHLMNNKGIGERIGARDGLLARLLERKLPDQRLVEELYLTCYARYPTRAEAVRAGRALAAAKDRRAAAEDLLWVLMNSKEFVFSH